MPCDHPRFEALVSVTGLIDDPAKDPATTPADHWSADIRIKCGECGDPPKEA